MPYKITANNKYCSFGLLVSNKFITFITLYFKKKENIALILLQELQNKNFKIKDMFLYYLMKHYPILIILKKYTNLTLKVGETNINAIKLYKKFGFIETGKDINTIFYNNNYYSLITMQKIMH